MKIYGSYPKWREVASGVVLMTVFGQLHHENEIPKARATEAASFAESIHHDFQGEDHILRALICLLADVPEEPLLSAASKQKGSVVGLTSLGFLLQNQSYGGRVRDMLKAGEGVVIFRILGDLDLPDFDVEIFATWSEYKEFLDQVLAQGDFVSTKNSTLL